MLYSKCIAVHRHNDKYMLLLCLVKKKSITCIFIDDISTLNMSSNRLNACIVRSHFLEKRVIRLQIKHAGNFPVVREFLGVICRRHYFVSDVCLLMDCVVLEIRICQNHVGIVVVHDYVWLLRGAIFRNDFNVRFMTGS